MKKKVFITSRSFGQVCDEPLNILKENNIEVEFKQKKELLGEDDFIKVIEEYDAIILGADRLTAKAIERGGKLKIICKHGAGVDNIDIIAARRKNIYVTNVPTANSDAVADVAMGLVIDGARRISYAAGRVKNGYWEKIIGTDVYKKTIGIIGYGAIGKRVARRAKGFDMEVLVFDPYLERIPGDFESIKLVSMDEVISNADFVTIHIPLNDKTRDLIDEQQLRRMKKGSMVINTSRGGIVNEEALYKYLANGHLGGAGLDVTENEPPFGSPLMTLDNVTILPHIASYSEEAINAVDMVCARNVVKALNGQQPGNML